MTARRTALAVLLEQSGPCPVCDEFDCEHDFYGEDHYRFGDRMEKHPRWRDPATHIPAPHRIVDEELERVVFGPGDLMTVEEAQRYGVLPPPTPDAPVRRKGVRQTVKGGDGARRPVEDRAHHPDRDR